VEETETLRHTKWDCKYHVVFIPKYRRQHSTRSYGITWATCCSLLSRKECRVEERHLLPDHVHMLLRFRPSIRSANRRVMKARARSTLPDVHGRSNYTRQHFWLVGIMCPQWQRGAYHPRVYPQAGVEDKRLDQLGLCNPAMRRLTRDRFERFTKQAA